jgi:Flp pilus assembly protein TadD
MPKLDIKYFAYDKAPPPRPIRMSVPGWSGPAQKMVDGSEPQPWHCLPFSEGSTYGLELLYPFDNECRVVNDNGFVRFEWDFASEPGAQLTGAEFVSFFPKESSKYYVFHTGLNVQAPPGHTLRTEPHPCFFTDDTGTVPCSLIGNVQTEWWPKRLFVAFRAPPPGRRHIFRRGEPYAQIIFVPQEMDYQLIPMTPEEEARRRRLETDVSLAGPQIARNIWHNPTGFEFNDHYKLMARAFSRGGMSGLEDEVRGAVERHKMGLPHDKPIAECLDMARQFLAAGEYIKARALYFHVIDRDPDNAQALCQLGVVAACMQSPLLALDLMSKAVRLQPGSAYFQGNLGELLRTMGRYPEAEAALRASLQINPGDANVLSGLALAVAHQERIQEAVQLAREALKLAPQSPVAYARMGAILALGGQATGAKTYYESALRFDPAFEEARQGLASLGPTPAHPS